MTSLAVRYAPPGHVPEARGSLLSIVHVLAPGVVGGAERVVQALAEGQRRRGHAVRVAAIVGPDAGEHPFVRALHDVGVETFALRLGDRAYLRERARVAEVCRRCRPDIVHTHGFRPDVLDAPMARRLGVPTVTTVHGFTGGGWRLRLYERLQRRAFRAFDAVVAVSRPLAESLAASGVGEERLHVIPNALPRGMRMLDRAAARRALSVQDGEFLIGWVGRLSAEKGADTLIDAAAQLTDVPARVAIFGDGDDRAMLSGRASILGLGDRITWHGVVSNASSYFRAFDVFVLSSRTEGCPMVLLEAMAAHVPIVATCVGGVPDVVSSAHAVLVRASDPGALAHGIAEVWRDPARAVIRAHAAHRRLIAEFHPDAWLDRYEELYHDLQGGAASGAR